MKRYLNNDENEINNIGQTYSLLLAEKKIHKSKTCVFKQVNELFNLDEKHDIPQDRVQYIIQNCHNYWKSGVVIDTKKAGPKGLLSHEQFRKVVIKVENLINENQLDYSKLHTQLDKARLTEIVREVVDKDYEGRFKSLRAVGKFSRFYLCQTLRPLILKEINPTSVNVGDFSDKRRHETMVSVETQTE